MEAELGKNYRDSISHFEGKATGRFEYLYGCVRIHLSGEINGEPKDFVFDEAQLVEIETETPVTTRGPGGPRPTPTR